MKEVNDIRDYRENKETQVWSLNIHIYIQNSTQQTSFMEGHVDNYTICSTVLYTYLF